MEEFIVLLYVMTDVYPGLHEFAEMDVHDPLRRELYFDRFAEQIILDGSMSDADPGVSDPKWWPFLILLPDSPAQR